MIPNTTLMSVNAYILIVYLPAGVGVKFSDEPVGECLLLSVLRIKHTILLVVCLSQLICQRLYSSTK